MDPEPPPNSEAIPDPTKKNWTHYQEIFAKGKAVFIANTDRVQMSLLPMTAPCCTSMPKRRWGKLEAGEHTEP
jgi:hypothetical protein